MINKKYYTGISSDNIQFLKQNRHFDTIYHIIIKF